MINRVRPLNSRSSFWRGNVTSRAEREGARAISCGQRKDVGDTKVGSHLPKISLHNKTMAVKVRIFLRSQIIDVMSVYYHVNVVAIISQIFLR